MVGIKNRNQNKVSQRQPLKDQINVIFSRNKAGRCIKALSNNTNNTYYEYCDENITKDPRYKKKDALKYYRNISNFCLVELRSKSDVVKMKELKVVLNREHFNVSQNILSKQSCIENVGNLHTKERKSLNIDLTEQMKGNYTRGRRSDSNEKSQNNLGKLSLSQNFNAPVNRRQRKEITVEIPNRKQNNKKEFQHNSVNTPAASQPTRSLTVILSRSPECSPEFFGFSKKEIKGVPSTPKSKADTPRTLKVVLQQLGPLNSSPEILGFTENVKGNVSTLTFTPKSEKVLLNRFKPTACSPSANIFVDDNVGINLRKCKHLGSKHISLDSNESNRESFINLPKKSCGNKLLEVSVKRNNQLEKRLLTQIDGVYHLSDTDFDNNFDTSPERPAEASVTKFNLDISPDFKGFEKEKSPVIKRVFETSSDEMHEYLNMLAKECNPQQQNKNSKKRGKNTTTNVKQLITTKKEQTNIKKKQQKVDPKKLNINEILLSAAKNQEKQVSQNNHAAKNTQKQILTKVNQDCNTRKSKKQDALTPLLLTTKNQEKQKGNNNNVAKRNQKPILSKVKQNHVIATNKKQAAGLASLRLKPYFHGFEEREQSSPTQKVTFENPDKYYLDIIEESVVENQPHLRKLPGKNYFEESSVENLEKPHMPLIRRMPIYKQLVPENRQNKAKDDEYEFTDVSPKKTINKKQLKRSSGFFDKDTHLVVKKLEKKELMKKKRQVKKKNNKKVAKNDIKSKSYEKTVEHILANTWQKVVQKKKLTVDENREKLDNKIEPPNQSNKNTVKAVVHTSQLSNIKNITEKSQNQEFSHNQNNIITVEALIHADTNTPGKVVPNDQKIMSKKVPEYSHYMITTRKCQNNPVEQNNDSPVVYNEQNVPDKNHDKILNIAEKNLNVAIQKTSNDFLLTMPEIQIATVEEIQTNLNETNDQQNFTYNFASNIQNDIDSSFGFDENMPQSSSPINPRINLISNVVINHKIQMPAIDSPVNFNVRRPNANSTMLGTGLNATNRRSGSPWRLNLQHVRQNPHFISVKANALPRIDQEPILNHTFVKEFESHCTKTPRIEETKKSPVQQSILNYVDCDNDTLEKENLPNPRCSLFDYEAFSSPGKKVTKRNERVQTAKRKILGDSDENNIINSTPVPEETYDGNEKNDMTYFGFDENSPEIGKKQKFKVTKTIYPAEAKPSRFNTNILKKYVSKKQLKDQQQNIVVPVDDVPSVSILNVSNDNSDSSSQVENAEIHLFDEPEELFDSKPVEIRVKRIKRPRTDSDDDPYDSDKRHKKHKKTKFEIEQEKWIKSFNKELEEVDNFDLPTE